MNKKVKLLSILIISAALCFVFAACNNNKDTINETNKPGETAGPTGDPTPTTVPPIYTDTLPKVSPDTNSYLKVSVTNSGYDVFTPMDDGSSYAYRYGPSMILNPDGSIDVWSSGLGSGGEWDWIMYTHSDDGGNTWSKEVAALQPSPNSMDHYSVCDPGVVYFNGYYYLGYTSTIYKTNSGTGNNAFVARSKNPAGPFEKWNGTGWGGDPSPIVYYEYPYMEGNWGTGEPSFVVVDNILYIYCSWHLSNGTGQIRVFTADATSENWPSTIQYKGVSLTTTLGVQDSVDVAYVEDYGKFMLISADKIRKADSMITVYESNDGLNFTRVNELKTNVMAFCHNSGLMKRPDGHVQIKDKIAVGYAYGSTWGVWATRITPITISLSSEKDFSDSANSNISTPFTRKAVPAENDLWPIAITTTPHFYEKRITDGNFDITLDWLDTMYKKHSITDASKVTFSGYDANVISFNGLTCTPIAVGYTKVTASYDGRFVTFVVSIKAQDSILAGELEYPKVKSLSATLGTYNVSISAGDQKQIRAYAVFVDDSWFELFNTAPYAGSRYKITYENYDTSLISISSAGVIQNKGTVGSTTVTVKLSGIDTQNNNAPYQLSYTATVNVVQ